MKHILAPVFFLIIIFTLTPKTNGAVIMTIDDPTDDVIDNGLCSIKEAFINAINENQSGSVDCPEGLHGPGVYVVIDIQTDIVLTQEYASTGYFLPGPGINMILNGNGHTISRNGLGPSFGLMRLVGFYNYEFNDVTFLGGRAVDNSDTDKLKGGALAIYAPSSVKFNNVNFINNTAEDGGAVYIRKDSAPETNVEITNSYFYQNETTNSGGAIRLEQLNLDISNSIFEENTSTFGGDGGAVFLDRTNAEINKTHFLNNGNPSSIRGGSVFSTSSSNNSLNISSSTFEGSYTQSFGSSVALGENINLNLENNTFFGDIGPGSASAVAFTETGNTINMRFNTFYGGINTYIRSLDLQTSANIENNIFVESVSGDICVGDFTNFNFVNNFSDVEDFDCGLIDNSPTGISGTLSLNGGDVKTLALLAGSSLLDSAVAGTLGCPDEDARGVLRPSGASCDVGAFEFEHPLPEIILVESDGSTIVSENGTNDTYTLVLNSQPSDDVIVNISFDSSKINTSPQIVTFTSSDWSSAQTITVSAVVDSSSYVDKNDTISHSVNSLDLSFDGIITPDVSVLIQNIHNRPQISSGGGYAPPSIPQEPIPGCTIFIALNYNPSAEVNDGGCIFPFFEILGCTNPFALNYNQSANKEDNSCVFEDVEEENFPPIIPEINLPTSPPVSPVELPIAENIEERPTNINETNNNLVNIKEDNLLLGFGEVLGIEEIKAVTESLPVAGIILPVVVFIVTQPGAAASIPIRLWSVFPTLIGLRRRKRPWGTVYDSITKQPLDPVYVSLKDESGKEIATTITDIDGRFGFLVPAGRYKISIHKDNYEFPSKKMQGKQKDELYGDLYFDEFIEIKGEEDILIKNIPMDPVKFNWNEFEKSKNKNLMRFYSKSEVFLANISNIVFYAGAVSSVVLLATNLIPINIIIFGIYLFISILRSLKIGPKKPGYVYDNLGYPLSFGVVRIYSADLDREISHSVIGKTGKYYSLARNGNYYAKISKKTGEDSYEEVHKTDIFKVKSGYVKEKIII